MALTETNETMTEAGTVNSRKLERFNKKIYMRQTDFRAQVLNMCLTVRRRSTTLRIELTIPMMVSSLFVVIAPFFGTFKDQVFEHFFPPCNIFSLKNYFKLRIISEVLRLIEILEFNLLLQLLFG